MRFFVADGPEEEGYPAVHGGGAGERLKEGWHESVPLIAAPIGGGPRRDLPAQSRGRRKLQPSEVGAISAV